MFNPELSDLSEELFELWDDCMSFPNLLAKVKRHKSLKIKFFDLNWEKQVWHLQDELAKLIQHEYDHLTEFWLPGAPLTINHFAGKHKKTDCINTTGFSYFINCSG